MFRTILIDVYECNGCGSCVELCPEVFRLNESGDKAELVETEPLVNEKVEEAAAYCPQKCILLS